MLTWLYTPIAWALKQWHTLFSSFLDPASGLAWALAIVFLVVTVRLLLFPLFRTQVRSQRAAQAIQPEVEELRARYGSDTRGLSAAVLALRRERGISPLAGCLPALLQAPVFLALLHVLRRIAPGRDGLYTWSYDLTQQAAAAEVSGVPISSSFSTGGPPSSWVVPLLLMVAMAGTSYLTQLQFQRRSGPVDGPAATVQLALRYGVPVSLFASGFFFPVGVLLYWATSNLWTLGQQFLLLRRLPPPGAAEAAVRVPADVPPAGPRTLAPRPGARPVRRRPGRAPGSGAG
jgi:YidC/Oxa1 family membrane protein insertase